MGCSIRSFLQETAMKATANAGNKESNPTGDPEAPRKALLEVQWSWYQSKNGHRIDYPSSLLDAILHPFRGKEVDTIEWAC